ncbi:hypothetical protein [Glutamicibacter ardleyensis]|uniref:hypothetical protein n=1 Tax=Glutamicibacter ardleyensis TaxID=225894 RepID=UPI003FD5FE3C
MGQREEYIGSDKHWKPSSTRHERLTAWWTRTSFGIALTGKVSRAVAESNRLLKAISTAHEMVLTQAVFALLEEGLNSRQIAEHLGYSKSHIARIIKSLSKDQKMQDNLRDGRYTNRTMSYPSSSESETREFVLKSWAMEDPEEWLKDHVRGSVETRSLKYPGNVGGTNGHGLDENGLYEVASRVLLNLHGITEPSDKQILAAMKRCADDPEGSRILADKLPIPEDRPYLRVAKSQMVYL